MGPIAGLRNRMSHGKATVSFVSLQQKLHISDICPAMVATQLARMDKLLDYLTYSHQLLRVWRMTESLAFNVSKLGEEHSVPARNVLLTVRNDC